MHAKKACVPAEKIESAKDPDQKRAQWASGASGKKPAIVPDI
jgi:hypothetical protein